MDIDTAFLNATLDEDIYMMLPPEGLDTGRQNFTVEEESLWTEAIPKELQQDSQQNYS
jgi:hypothetical protein